MLLVVGTRVSQCSNLTLSVSVRLDRSGSVRPRSARMLLCGWPMRRIQHPYRLAGRQPLPATDDQPVALGKRAANLHHIGDSGTGGDIELLDRVGAGDAQHVGMV